jgi:hypothetical protein
VQARGYIIASVNGGPHVTVPFEIDTDQIIVTARYGEDGSVCDASSPHPLMRDFHETVLSAIAAHGRPQMSMSGD